MISEYLYNLRVVKLLLRKILNTGKIKKKIYKFGCIYI